MGGSCCLYSKYPCQRRHRHSDVIEADEIKKHRLQDVQAVDRPRVMSVTPSTAFICCLHLAPFIAST